MMAAMMLPAAAPMIVTFASAQARRHRCGRVPTWIFVAGYLLVWAAVGGVVYLVVQSAATRRITAAVGPGPVGAARAGGDFAGGRAISSRRSSAFASVIAARPWRSWRSIGATASGCAPDGASARRVLSRLLLGAVRRARRCGGDEPRLDASAHAGRFRREGAPAWPTRFSDDRLCPDWPWAGGGRCESLNVPHSDAPN